MIAPRRIPPMRTKNAQFARFRATGFLFIAMLFALERANLCTRLRSSKCKENYKQH
jgi:hypothetical protein